MLELSSLRDVEPALRAEGFFEGGADGLVADVYLGYGLSDGLRRTAASSPPEPCPLPRAALGIRADEEPYPRGGAYEIGAWEPTWSKTEYAAAIESVREAIAAGDVYQVNLVQHLSAPFSGDPVQLAERLAPLRPLAPGRCRRRLGDRLGVPGALPRAARAPGMDDADQGHAAGGRRRPGRVREGCGRARDDRRSRAERSRRASANGDPCAGRR